MAGEGPMMSTQAPAGSVPSQSGGATVNPAEVIDKVLQRNTQELSKYAIAAATPIPGGSQGQMPTKFMQPQQEAGRAELDHREVVGAGNAKAQGIGNTVIAALNTISAVKTGMDNKKKVEIASSTQQLLQAQAASNQAEQLLQTDPNNAQAKEQLEHNNQIMGTILTGKHGKDIMKGFNIDYTDPESNKTPQHDAVADGKKRAEAAVQAFNKGTPETMAPNTQAQVLYAAKQEEAKNTVNTMKSMVPLISAQLRADAMDRQTSGRITVETMKDINAQARAYTASQAAMDRLSQRFKNEVELQKNKHNDRLSEIQKHADLDLSNYQAKLTSKDNDPLTRQKAKDDFEAKSAARSSAMQMNLANLTAIRSSLATKATNHPAAAPEELKRIDDAIYLQQQQIQAFNEAKAGSNAFYQELTKKEGQVNAPGSSTNKPSNAGLGSAASYLNASDSLSDDDDEDSPDNN